MDVDDFDALALDDTPPTQGLASYDRFVKWVLLSPPAALGDFSAWPADLDALDIEAKADEPQAPSLTDTKLQLAVAEAITEELRDTLFELERECDAVAETAATLIDDQRDAQAHITRLETTILRQLQERDASIADQFALEQKISQLTSDDAPKLRRGPVLSLALPWAGLRSSDPRHSVKKEIEHYEKLLAHAKLSLAEAKADLDLEKFSTRSLEKQCARLQTELIAASTAEDELRRQLDAANASHQALLTKLSLVPQFAAKLYKAKLRRPATEGTS
ncbi:hypothetical protein ACHHYP_13217 [Achlya hypogyna]|uniref:Uncharacterized protein n=1 Tax=Achlya hypogyna TaxID=1202772 RepID=A0A1V9ZFQ1_ACHHY|nr:hypothetical protein ACHHYP_13217 [Achlya hypogyna]